MILTSRKSQECEGGASGRYLACLPLHAKEWVAMSIGGGYLKAEEKLI
jgi:hypothetical protein